MHPIPRAIASLIPAVALLAAPSARADEPPRPVAPAPVPAPPPPAAPRMVPASEGKMTTGIVLTVLGGTALLAATAVGLYVVGGCKGNGDCTMIYGIIAGATAAPGVVLAAVGIPLWVVGAKQVPAPPAASALPRVTVSPMGGALRWTF
jgi:hypothetical protein